MSNTAPTAVDVSDSEKNSVLERPSHEYSYLGQDAEGYHHHVDEATTTVYVTTARAERFRPDSTDRAWFRVCGDVDHVEPLEQHDNRGLTEWVAYVDSVRGWHDRPLESSSILTAVLAQWGDQR
jgi:hypothetical protein